MTQPDMTRDDPLIVGDVDGVLNPYSPSSGFKEHIVRPDCRWWNPENRLSVWLNPLHGVWLNELANSTGAQLVWGTGWEEAANDCISPLIGLPQLPVIPIPSRNGQNISFGAWKAQQVIAWAGDRPFVWFDDEPDARAAVAKNATDRQLVIEVNPRRGLLRHHIIRACRFLRALSS